jgi:hypothetical protein
VSNTLLLAEGQLHSALLHLPSARFNYLAGIERCQHPRPGYAPAAPPHPRWPQQEMSGRAAFSSLSPFPKFQGPARRVRVCHAQAKPTVRASSAVPTPASTSARVAHPATKDELHPSWGVYERAGNQCVICDGTGRCKCLYCFGDGVVFIGPEKERDGIVCPQCLGKTAEPCARCAGTGVRPSTRFDPRTMKEVANRTNQDVIDGVGEQPTRMFSEGDGAGDALDVGTDGKEVPEAVADAR